MLGGCFALQKLYGRSVENTKGIIQIFHRLLSDYPAEKVIKAFEKWIERSQEFPTPADIIGLIKRNGKPPYERSRYIAIMKKDGLERSREEWDYVRAYEAELQDGF